jgi:hypothetical protein
MRYRKTSSVALETYHSLEVRVLMAVAAGKASEEREKDFNSNRSFPYPRKKRRIVSALSYLV